MDSTRNILSKIRSLVNENNKSFIKAEDYGKHIINENTSVQDSGIDDSHRESISISKNDTQFGDVYRGQTDAIRKTISSNVKFGDKALTYYPGASDITLDFAIPYLNAKVQFRLNDASGSGCFITTEAFSMNEENNKTLFKVWDAYKNWKDSITEQDDLFDRLDKYAKK